MATSIASARFEEDVQIHTPAGQIDGIVAIPQNAQGVVIFAHGSGSGRHSPRNRFVAESLQGAGLATLLIDLLTVGEEQRDRITAEHRFDIHLLAERLNNATDWLAVNYRRHNFRFGYFGASTGAAAALIAAAERTDIGAVVSRGGRPDLAGDALAQVRAATLLIVGGWDDVVIDLNEQAFAQMRRASHKHLEIIPQATHLFEEPGKLEEVSRLAGEWFSQYLNPADRGN
jgi:putative phosphoribosyl transferase